MKENDASKVIAKFEKLIGPVARAIANETAEDMGMLKGGRISPSSRKEYDSLMGKLGERYSKILGKPLVGKMMSEQV
ncbi:Uncharacterised protein [uncultured archaeon]|nr:Uncharacterised protein [uncultured archaeon]